MREGEVEKGDGNIDGLLKCSGAAERDKEMNQKANEGEGNEGAREDLNLSGEDNAKDRDRGLYYGFPRSY